VTLNWRLNPEGCRPLMDLPSWLPDAPLRPKRFFPDPVLFEAPKLIELPMDKKDGAPAGVVEATEDGGGTAGVVV
jgi:hypothetical protein